MADKKRCETCTEECAKSQMAHEAAVSRMYATKQFVALQKKIESGQLVEVVRCKDCKHFREYTTGGTVCIKDVKLLGGREVGIRVTEKDDFCSYGGKAKW